MTRKFVDTNIFLRYLTGDDPATYARCRELFQKVAAGKTEVTTSGMVIAELVWTLLSYYKVPKPDVVDKVSVIVSTENIHIPDKDIIIDALILFGSKAVDYIDAYNAVFMKYNAMHGIYSYDRDFDVIENIEREEP